MNIKILDRKTPQIAPSSTIEYEDYNSTSSSYDHTRTPVGLPVILDFLASTRTPPSEQTVLDAGCGTGSYLAELRGRIEKLHGLELNTGMQRIAKERFVDAPDVQVTQGSITELAFADGTVDGVICNQVIHHLDHGECGDGDADDFPNVKRFYRESFRVLRSGGVLIINTSSHLQHREGFWWAALIPEAIDRILRRFPSIEKLESFAQEAGFIGNEVVVPVTEALQGEQYLNPEGPLSAAWRAGDSAWSLATEEELSHAIDDVTSRIENGGMAAFLEAAEQRRATIGQITFLAVHKP